MRLLQGLGQFHALSAQSSLWM